MDYDNRFARETLYGIKAEEHQKLAGNLEDDQDEIEAEIRCGSLSRKNFSQDLDDGNTELFFIRQKNGSFDYAVTVNVFLSDDEQTETASIRLAGLTPQERNYIDMLIQERVIYALRHIDE